MLFPSPCPAELCLRPHHDDDDDTVLVVYTNEGRNEDRNEGRGRRSDGRQNVDCGPYSALIGRRRGLLVPLYQKGRLNVDDLTATMMRRLSQTALTNDVKSRRQIVGPPSNRRCA